MAFVTETNLLIFICLMILMRYLCNIAIDQFRYVNIQTWHRGLRKQKERRNFLFLHPSEPSMNTVIGLSKCKEDHYSERLNLCSCEKKAGIRTLTRLCDTGERRSNQLS